jgi:hypothetical protein
MACRGTALLYFTFFNYFIIILLFTGAYSLGRTFSLPFRGFLFTHTDTR